MIASDRLFEPFKQGTTSFPHGYTFGGHPVSAAVAMANLDIFEREGLNDHVKENAPIFQATLEKLLDLPLVGDVRGAGYFYGIELVKDKETRETFNDAESERLLRGFLSKALFDAGLYCRADDRGDPVIQLAPPLIIGQTEFDDIESRLRSVLTRGREPPLTRQGWHAARRTAGGRTTHVCTNVSKSGCAHVCQKSPCSDCPSLVPIPASDDRATSLPVPTYGNWIVSRSSVTPIGNPAGHVRPTRYA